jgi:methylated-DNA-protein-cysteine methyltransferase-like protein
MSVAVGVSGGGPGRSTAVLALRGSVGAATMVAMTRFERDVAAVLASIGPGQVMTYGEVAAEAGHPGAARAVGRFLATHPGFHWWRVVTATGRLVPGQESSHATLLAAEGVLVADGRVAFPQR